jgi:hypothetical protein
MVFDILDSYGWYVFAGMTLLGFTGMTLCIISVYNRIPMRVHPHLFYKTCCKEYAELRKTREASYQLQEEAFSKTIVDYWKRRQLAQAPMELIPLIREEPIPEVLLSLRV